LAQPADLPGLELDADDQGPQDAAVPRGWAPSVRRVADRPRRVLDLQHAEHEAVQRRDAGPRGLADDDQAHRQVTAFPDESGPPRLGLSMLKKAVLAATVIVFLTAAGTATAVLLQVDDAINHFI